MSKRTVERDKAAADFGVSAREARHKFIVDLAAQIEAERQTLPD